MPMLIEIFCLDGEICFGSESELLINDIEVAKAFELLDGDHAWLIWAMSTDRVGPGDLANLAANEANSLIYYSEDDGPVEGHYSVSCYPSGSVVSELGTIGNHDVLGELGITLKTMRDKTRDRGLPDHLAPIYACLILSTAPIDVNEFAE